MVRAGTGTGKSLAYLLPAVLSGKRVVVATATKALQDQLFLKDLPFLAKQLAPESTFSYAILKGRSNYLCRQRIAEAPDPGTATGEVRQGQLGEPEPAEPPAPPYRSASSDPTSQLREIVAWASRTSSGERSDLDFEPLPQVWAAVSTAARECPGAFRCPSGDSCFAERARERAAEADVVVVNTHLYAAHLASGGVVLPPHDTVVFDEAHEVEEIMTSGLGIELTSGRLAQLAQSARALLGAKRTTSRDRAASSPDAGAAQSPADAVADVASQIDGALGELVGQRVLTGQRVPVHGPLAGGSGDEEAWSQATYPEPVAIERAAPMVRHASPAGAESPGAVGASGSSGSSGSPGSPGSPGSGARGPDEALRSLLSLARSRVTALVEALRAAGRDQLAGRLPVDAPGADENAARRSRLVMSAGHLLDDMDRLLALDEGHVAWVERRGMGGRVLVLRAAPIDVGPLLAESLWPEVTAVLTSATIPDGLGQRLGLPGDLTDQLDVGSPFPYERNTLVYCPTDLPDRREANCEAALHGEMELLARAAGGRMLALFTSWRAMTAALDALRGRLEFPILAQGEMPKSRLVETFAADPAACLFATISFWQGVDVPGETLSLVVIDRLPFARVDDPLVEARRERAGSAAFRLVDLPRAATMLAQGAGRLVRSASDRGVVAVLDRRLATAGYRKTLLAALAPMPLTTDRAAAIAMLERIRSGVQT